MGNLAIKAEDDHGQIHDYLGILDAPTNPHYAKVRPLLKLCSNKTDLAGILDVQRPQLYQDRLSLKNNQTLKKRIVILVVVADLAFELLNKNLIKTFKWLVTPNTMFFGDSPFELVMRDQGESIISWLLERLGKRPGSAF